MGKTNLITLCLKLDVTILSHSVIHTKTTSDEHQVVPDRVSKN